MSHLLSRPSRRRVIAIATSLIFVAATSGLPLMAVPPAGKGPQLPATMLPVSITEVVVNPAGNLEVHGLIGDNPFTAPITITTEPNPDDPDCPILNLELGPIHLDLLGLVVDTSAICVRIVAEPGAGNLLGNLLCAIAGLLDDGLDLGDILDLLDPDQLLAFLAFLEFLEDLLQDLFDQVTAPAAIVGVSDSLAVGPAHHQPGHGGGGGGHCDILNLAVGPIHLDLLGLVVDIDDCEGGPVTVDITAEPGPGNLLGNLLCRLAGLLDRPNVTDAALAALLNRIADAILDLLG